jgi:aryl-alcohol dehydrogenase-like predicted oxidoreductase
MGIDGYRPLGRSGLRVSPIALGTMTFGRADWGCDDATSAQLLDTYLEAGGNFLDTADTYSNGACETLIGKWLTERGVRERTVLATKFSLAARAADDPNGSGNGRKNMVRALEGSLRRLGTDYIDLYYLHAWDSITSADEVMRGLDDLVTQGKIRYVGLSDVPAWYAARAQTISQWRGFEPVCALQLEYSLVERGIEAEFPDLCAEFGMELVTWSPLANGLLSGKYSATTAASGDLPAGRIRTTAATMPPELDRRNAHTWQVVDALAKIATEVGQTPAQVAINWVANRPAVNSVILGASTVAQLATTIRSVDFALPVDARNRLDELTAPRRGAPHTTIALVGGSVNQNVLPRR